MVSILCFHPFCQDYQVLIIFPFSNFFIWSSFKASQMLSVNLTLSSYNFFFTLPCQIYLSKIEIGSITVVFKNLQWLYNAYRIKSKLFHGPDNFYDTAKHVLWHHLLLFPFIFSLSTKLLFHQMYYMIQYTYSFAALVFFLDSFAFLSSMIVPMKKNLC